ncbi:MAG: hypothetical protein D6819_06220 [Gammaproteobacteria bacterium]|nr:MAG: hypothetical protein D6819_06220 [Gammaproteobacteria bacterium]
MSVLRLYPPPHERLPLRGLYLTHDLHRQGKTCLYTNFISSLDGRIALKENGAFRVPRAIANPRDWRLFQELAAQAEAMIIGTGYLRALARGAVENILHLEDDLRTWRRAQGLSPQPAAIVLSASLDIPPGLPFPLILITGKKAPQERLATLQEQGVQVLFAGEGGKVEPQALGELVPHLGFRSIYSAAGPGVLRLLLEAGLLDRLYLTLSHHLLAGDAFKTLLEGPPLDPPIALRLQGLAYDEGPGQWFVWFS